jgi:hypothetical protein
VPPWRRRLSRENRFGNAGGGRRAGAPAAKAAGWNYDKPRLGSLRQEGWSYTADAERVREIFRRVLAGERIFGRLADEMQVSRTLLRLILRRSEYTGWRVYEKRVGGKYPSGRTRLVPRRPEDVIRIRLPLEPLIPPNHDTRRRRTPRNPSA